MAGHLRYIRRRKVGGVFYYERRVPRDILDLPEAWNRYFGGVRLYRRSLCTKRQADAMRLGVEAHEDFERRRSWATGGRSVEVATDDNSTRRLTPEFLAKLTAEAQDMAIKPWAQQMLRAEVNEHHADELGRMVQQRELDAEELLAAIVDPTKQPGPRFLNIREYVERKVREERIDAPAGSDQRAVVARGVREGIIAGERYVDDMLAGRAPIPISRLASRRSSAPKISEVVADYADKLVAGRTIREVNGALASFIAAVGDLPLDEISRTDFIRFCEREGGRTVGGKDPKSIARPVSADTLKKKVGLLRSAINRAIQRDPSLGPNPAANIDASLFTKPVPKALMPAKRPFDVHELKLILQHPWFTGCVSESKSHEPGDLRLTGAHYWVPVLAMYTGCRAGELGGLRVSEVRLTHQHPHIVIQDNDYRSTKGSYRRKIPVLDVLLEHGFGEFVERVALEGNDRLFPDWKAPAGRVDASSTAWSNAAIIRSFNRTVLPQQLKGILQPGVRQEVTFHGFRGAFKTLLGRQEYGVQVNYKHEIIGHAKDGLDKRYVGEIDIAETYAAVRHCRYHGLTLPPAP